MVNIFKKLAGLNGKKSPAENEELAEETSADAPDELASL